MSLTGRREQSRSASDKSRAQRDFRQGQEQPARPGDSFLPVSQASANADLARSRGCCLCRPGGGDLCPEAAEAQCSQVVTAFQVMFPCSSLPRSHLLSGLPQPQRWLASPPRLCKHRPHSSRVRDFHYSIPPALPRAPFLAAHASSLSSICSYISLCFLQSSCQFLTS